MGVINFSAVRAHIYCIWPTCCLQHAQPNLAVQLKRVCCVLLLSGGSQPSHILTAVPLPALALLMNKLLATAI